MIFIESTSTTTEKKTRKLIGKVMGKSGIHPKKRMIPKTMPKLIPRMIPVMILRQRCVSNKDSSKSGGSTRTSRRCHLIPPRSLIPAPPAAAATVIAIGRRRSGIGTGNRWSGRIMISLLVIGLFVIGRSHGNIRPIDGRKMIAAAMPSSKSSSTSRRMIVVIRRPTALAPTTVMSSNIDSGKTTHGRRLIGKTIVKLGSGSIGFGNKKKTKGQRVVGSKIGLLIILRLAALMISPAALMIGALSPAALMILVRLRIALAPVVPSRQAQMVKLRPCLPRI